MLFPIDDDDRHLTRPALVTIALVAANVIVFAWFQQFGANEAFTTGFSVIPYEITHGVDLTEPLSLQTTEGAVVIRHSAGPTPIYLTLLSAMFMHAGFVHLFGNLLYLWIFGDNIEHRFGAPAFLLFYLASGLAATGAQIALNPAGIIPNLGASGAISGVLGAYLVLFPRNRVKAIFFIAIVSVPAVLVIGLWVAFQLLQGWGTLGAEAGGVAYGAHLGGFAAGAFIALIWRLRVPREPPSVFTRSDSLDRSRRIW